MPPRPHHLRALLDAIGETDPVVRWEAAKVLIARGDRRAVPPLVRLIKGPGESGQRAAAAYVLGGLRDTRATVPLMDVVWNRQEDPELRGHAAEALAYLRKRRALPALISALDDPAPSVRFWSAFALGELGDTRAIPALERVAALDDTPVPGWWTVGEEARHALHHLKSHQDDP